MTRELAQVAGLVLAVELDERLARRLVNGTFAWPNVYVHGGDAVDAALPETPFRVVGNIPFQITTPILRRIVGHPHARRLDVILQHEAAKKRARSGGSVLSVLWHVAWRFGLRRRIPARLFHPPPSVDAAWLTGTRREAPLIPAGEMRSFERTVRTGFARADLPIARSLGLRPSVIRLTGVSADVRDADLDVEGWVSISRAARG
jgi:23S rRNA (adenine-N6)-dimethyltransferase